MNCTSCDHLNPDAARFCNRCGTALEISCSSCSQPNPPDSRFCNHCGTQLTEPTAEDAPAPRDYTPKHLAERILRQKAALEGERKHVTVLFADLADSTELAEQLGPEGMHALMDRAFKCILTQVHRYEGTVNQFTGDGVMALFGAPLALEDAPRKAVIAALAIHHELEAIDAEIRSAHGRSFEMRIGINTGPVVVGKIGDDLRMDYTAVGDTTNLAARLEQISAPGGVVVSESTRRLSEGYFDFRALEPTSVKGKGAAIQAFEVLAKRTASGRIDVLTESGFTPFVGRDAESDALLAAFESARAGRGKLAFLVGEAGLGKSRLKRDSENRASSTNSVGNWPTCRTAGSKEGARHSPRPRHFTRSSTGSAAVRGSTIKTTTRQLPRSWRARNSMPGADWNGRSRSCATCFRCPAGMSRSTPSMR